MNDFDALITDYHELMEGRANDAVRGLLVNVSAEDSMPAQKGPPKSPQASGGGGKTTKGGVGSNQSKGAASSSGAGKQIGRGAKNARAPKGV